MPADVTLDLLLRDAQFRAAFRRVEGTLRRVRASMEGVIRSAKRMMLGLIAAGTAAVVSFARFEQQMARVKALSGATGAEFQRLESFAREMGKTTVFAATEAADAMAEFALRGFNAEQIIAALPHTLKLAAAAQLGMAQATSITAGIMRGMKLDVSQLGTVVDVLAKAATTGATDVPQLGEAMRKLGPVAFSAGVDLEEAVAVIRAMSDVMIQGSDAGTALRNILLRLQAQPTELAKRFAELNFTIDNGRGGMKTLADIVDELATALSKKTVIARNAAIADIGGMRAAAALTEILSLGGDVIRGYVTELRNAGDTAQTIADIQLDTLIGSFKLLQSAITDIAISIGAELKPSLEYMLDALTALANAASNATDTGKALFKVLGGGIIVVPALTLAVGALVSSLRVLITTLLTVWPYLVGFFGVGPGSLLVAGAVAIAAAQGKVIGLQIALERMARSSRDAAKAFKEVADARKELSAAETVDARTSAMEREIAGRQRQLRDLRTFLQELQAIPKEMQLLPQQEEGLNAKILRFAAGGAQPFVPMALSAGGGMTRPAEMVSPAQGAIDTTTRSIEKLVAVIDGLKQKLKEVQQQAAVAPIVPLPEILERSNFGIVRLFGSLEKLNRSFVKWLEAQRAGAERLKDVTREIAIARGTATREDFELQDLAAQGTSAFFVDQLRAKFQTLADLQAQDKPQFAAQGRIESVEATFRRIQESAAGRRDPATIAAQQTAKSTQQTAQQTRSNQTVLEQIRAGVRDMVNAVRGLSLGYGP